MEVEIEDDDCYELVEIEDDELVVIDVIDDDEVSENEEIEIEIEVNTDEKGPSYSHTTYFKIENESASCPNTDAKVIPSSDNQKEHEPENVEMLKFKSEPELDLPTLTYEELGISEKCGKKETMMDQRKQMNQQWSELRNQLSGQLEHFHKLAEQQLCQEEDKMEEERHILKRLQQKLQHRRQFPKRLANRQQPGVPKIEPMKKMDLEQTFDPLLKLSNGNYRCSHCPKQSPVEDNIKLHIRHVHPYMGGVLLVHRCFLCEKEFSTKTHLEKHARICDGNRRLYHCGECGKTYTFEYKLNAHFRTYHMKNNEGNAYMDRTVSVSLSTTNEGGRTKRSY